MKEDFIHYLWKFKKFNPRALETTSGEEIQIMHPGYHNRDGGPDFINAKIRINNTLWAGNVEMHINASDWYKHGHNKDEKYNNVILHVVAKNDKEVLRQNEDPLPCLNISPHIQMHAWQQYQKLLSEDKQIPCASFLNDIDTFKVHHWLERVITDRLESKTAKVEKLLTEHQQDWENVFFILLSRYLAGNVNQLPMELLAKQTPYQTILKHHDNVYDLESILFGQSGLLNLTKEADAYTEKLRKNYQHFQAAYNLKQINPTMWQFLRLRPGNFPSIRIAQLSALYHQTPRLLGALIKANKPASALGILSTTASAYWDEHYVFGKKSAKRKKRIGKTTANSILINVVVPFLFVYGKIRGIASMQDKAIDWLTQIQAEDNRIIRMWKTYGIKAENALHTQALIELKQNYCTPRRCLDCNIGHEILKA